MFLTTRLRELVPQATDELGVFDLGVIIELSEQTSAAPDDGESLRLRGWREESANLKGSCVAYLVDVPAENHLHAV